MGRLKHTLIVGGTRGIGEALVNYFANGSYLISVIARQVPSEIEAHSTNVSYWAADVSDQKKIDEVLENILKKNHKIDSVIFFQRYRSNGKPWEGEIAVSLTGTKNVIDSLVNKEAFLADATIVVVSSVNAHLISKQLSLSYHIVKAALNQLVRYFAVILGPKGIRVNSISSGTILKESEEIFLSKHKALYNFYKNVVPLRRLGTSLEIARIIDFLCSQSSSFITGQNIVVDGGASLLLQETLVT